MATKWWDVATYEGPMSVVPPPTGPQPKGKGDISSWVAAVKAEQAKALAEAKRQEEERKREQERQRVLAEQRAKVAAQLAKQAEAQRAKEAPLQVSRSGQQDMTSQAPQIRQSAPLPSTVPYRPPQIQGPQPRPQPKPEQDRFGVSAFLPPKGSASTAGTQNAVVGLGQQLYQNPQLRQQVGQGIVGGLGELGDALARWARPANTQFLGMQENREAERQRQNRLDQERKERERLEKLRKQAEGQSNIDPMTRTSPFQPGSTANQQPFDLVESGQLTPDAMPTTKTDLDFAAINQNLRRNVPGYSQAADTLKTYTQYGMGSLFDAGQYLDDLWRGIGTERTTASDVFGAAKKGLVDTVTQMGADPLTLVNAQRNGTWNMASTLTEDFATRFAQNYQPALDALRESHEKPIGPLPKEVEKAWDVSVLLFDPEDRKQAIDAIANKEEAIGRMQYAAGKYLARAYEPWVTADSPSAAWNKSGLTQEQWTEANAAIAADLGMQAERLKLGNYATALEANRNLGDELITGFLGLTPLDAWGRTAKALRLTPKPRAFDKVLSEFSIEADEAARLLHLENNAARSLVGQQLITTNPVKQFFTPTRMSRALTQADNLFRQTAFLFGIAETAEDGRLLLKTLKNNPAALVTGIQRDALTSPRLQALAAEDGLARFGEWMAAPRLRESQKVLAEIDDEVLDAMIPGVPVFDVAAKVEAMDNARIGFQSAAMRKYGATKEGVAADIPMGVLDARAYAAERGTWRVEFRGPSGTVVRTSEPMTKVQAEALSARTMAVDKTTRNIVQTFADTQRKIMSAAWLNTRPGHWVRNALSATGHLYMDDLFSFANNAEIDSYFRRMAGGVEDITPRLAEGTGSLGQHMAGIDKKGGNVLDRANQKARAIWTGDWEIPLPGGKSLPFPEGSNYRKGHYRAHREFMEEGIGRIVGGAPEQIQRSPYGPVLLAGLKHAALKDGEQGIANYLKQIETFRLPFVPPASITHPMDSVSGEMWDDIARLFGTAMSKEEYQNGLDTIFKNGVGKWQESLRRDPIAMGQRTFTKMDAAEDVNERIEEAAALGKRLGMDEQAIQAKQAQIRATAEEQQAQVAAVRQQLHDAVAATKEPDALMRAVDMHEDVYELTEKARETQSALVKEALGKGTNEAWLRYGEQIDEVWNRTHDEAMARMQTALDELTGKAAERTRPPRYRLLQRLLETDEAQIAKDRQYVRQVGDWSGALQKKIDAQRATVDRALARNSFVARQTMSVETMDEIFDMHVYLRGLGARAAAERRAVNEAKQAAIEMGMKPELAQAKADPELERIWKEWTDASEAYIDTVTVSLARKSRPIDAGTVLREAEEGIGREVQSNPPVSTPDVASTATTPTVSRQALEEERYQIQEEMVRRQLEGEATGTAAQKRAALAEAEALAQRLDIVEQRLASMPEEAPAPRPATVQKTVDNRTSTVDDRTKPYIDRTSTVPTPAPPKVDLQPLMAAAQRAGIELTSGETRIPTKHLVRSINRHEVVGRKITSLNELTEADVQTAAAFYNKRTATTKRVDDIIKQARQGEAEAYARADEARRAAPTTVEPEASAPTVFYRGTVPGNPQRIDEPFEAARGMTFVARTEKGASNYGSSIERIEANPGAKILYEESDEFWKLIGRKRPPNGSIMSASRKNETPIDAVNDAIRKAKSAGYDAVSFTKDGDIGTVLLNESAFRRNVQDAPKRPVMGDYPEGMPERQLEAAPRLLEEEDLPLLSLPKETSLEREPWEMSIREWASSSSNRGAIDSLQRRIAAAERRITQKSKSAYTGTATWRPPAINAEISKANANVVDKAEQEIIELRRQLRETEAAAAISPAIEDEYMRIVGDAIAQGKPVKQSVIEDYGLWQLEKGITPKPPQGDDDELLSRLMASESPHVQVAYNGKIVDMSYVNPGKKPVLKDQFLIATHRIQDNLGTGGFTSTSGYVKMPNGELFTVERGKGPAKKMSPPSSTPPPATPEVSLGRIDQLRAEREGLTDTRRTMLEQWDRAAAHWGGLPNAQSLARKLAGGGTSDLRIEGYDWQSWPKLRDFADSLLGKGATTGDVGKWLNDYTTLNRQLADIQGDFNAIKQGGESLAQATKRIANEGKVSDDLSKLSRREVVERYGEQLKEMGYTTAELNKMKVAELKEAVRTLRGDDASAGWATYESTIPAYQPTGKEGKPLLGKWFKLEEGVTPEQAYFENSHAMRQTNAASLTTADIGMFHLRQAHHAYEELYKMGDDLFNPKIISRAEAAAFGQWARQEAVPQFRNTLAQAGEAAKQAADFAMLNYSNTYGFDEWLNVLVPYHIYRTRTFKNTARRLLTRPDHLANFLRVERAIERNNEREGNRPRMEGRIPIPGTDGYAITNPLRYVLPYYDQLPRQNWDNDGTRELSTIERIMNGADAAGFSAMPAIALAYQMGTGREGEIRAIVPHTQVLIKLVRAMGVDVPYMQPNVATRLAGLTDDWDADRLVRAMAVLQQEGALNLTESQAGWLRDTIAIKTGKAEGPLPEMPAGMEPFFQQVEARAASDDNVRVLSNFFLGLGIARQPEAERQIYRNMDQYFGMQYDPEENPFGSRGDRSPTPAAQTVMGRGFFYPDADPSIKRPGIGAATGDFYDQRRLLVEQREADINSLYAGNPEATYEEEQAIYQRFLAQEAALKARFPSADTETFGPAVKAGMNPMEGKHAIFGEFLNWFEHDFPGKPQHPGEGASWAAKVKWRQDTAAWEAKRLAALAGVINQGGLKAFLRGGTPEQALNEYRRSEMTEAEGRVKTQKRAESQELAAIEAAMIDKYGPNVFTVMEGSIGLKGDAWRAYHEQYPWLDGAWDEYNARKAANAEKGQGAFTLRDWVSRLSGKPELVNAAFDAAKYGIAKDKNGTLVAKKPTAEAGKKKGTAGEDDPLRALKDKYYSFDKDDWDGKCAYLHSEAGAPLLADWSAKYPDAWFVGCQSGSGRGGGGRYYGGGGGGGYFAYPPQIRVEGMNPELWDLRGVPRYYAPEDRTRFWLDEGDRLRPEQLRAWRPPQ